MKSDWCMRRFLSEEISFLFAIFPNGPLTCATLMISLVCRDGITWCVVAGKSGSGHCPKEWTRSQWTANTLEKSEQKRERAIVKEWEKNVVAHDSSGLFLARGGGKRQMSDKFRWLRGVLMVSPVPRRVMSRSLTGSVKGEMRRKLVFLRHCVRARMRACLCACVCVCANSVTKPSP